MSCFFLACFVAQKAVEVFISRNLRSSGSISDETRRVLQKCAPGQDLGIFILKFLWYMPEPQPGSPWKSTLLVSAAHARTTAGLALDRACISTDRPVHQDFFLRAPGPQLEHIQRSLRQSGFSYLLPQQAFTTSLKTRERRCQSHQGLPARLLNHQRCADTTN